MNCATTLGTMETALLQSGTGGIGSEGSLLGPLSIYVPGKGAGGTLTLAPTLC